MRDNQQLERLYRGELQTWARAVADQRQSFFDALQSLARRVHREGSVASGEWEFNRWFTQAHLLLVCIRNVWRFATALQSVNPDEQNASHIATFEHLVAPAAEFRDLLEHVDEYARGRGRLQRKGQLPRPEELGEMAMDEGRFPSIEYRFGGKSINVDDAATAAITLAQMILGTQFVRPEGHSQNRQLNQPRPDVS